MAHGGLSQVLLGLLALVACGRTQQEGQQASGGVAGGEVGGSTANHAGERPGGREGADAGETSVGGVSGSAGAAGLAGVGGVSTACGPTDPGAVSGKSDFGNQGWHCSWFLSGCLAREQGDCLTLLNDCPAAQGGDGGPNGLTTETFPIGGTPGQKYKATFEFSAVVEAKEYSGGTRDAGDSAPPTDDDATVDAFYRDGEPVPSNHDVWQLNTFDNNMLLARRFFMNAFPAGFETQRTFLVQYKKTIVVVGGGKIEHVVRNDDCRSTDNCGPGEVTVDCPAPRILPSSRSIATLPTYYRNPQSGMVEPTRQLSIFNQVVDQPWHAQLGHLVVTSIEPTNDPVTTDYP